jgi:Ca2+-binding RTX toxin-like protein
MRRVVLVVAGIALALVLASGVALALNEIGTTNGPDTLRGTNGADNLLGEGANDVLFGLGGRDNLVGGPGKDWVLGGNERRPQRGDKNLLGESGNDGVLGGRGSDNAVGGSGNDLVFGERGSDRVVGEEGRDLLDGGRGSDRIVGEEGSDWLVDGPFGDTSKDDTLSGGDGNDVFFVDNGPPTRDIVSCGGGFDRLAADTKDRVAADCEKVRRGPTAGQELNEELEEESGFAENFFEDLALAPFPE